MASEYTTFPVGGPIKLVARLGPGRLEVAARDNLAHAAVRLTPRHPQSDVLDHVVVEMRGSTLVISGPRQSGWTDVIGGWRRGRELVDTLIEVPSGTPLKLSSSGDEITLTGCGGDTDDRDQRHTHHPGDGDRPAAVALRPRREPRRQG